NMAISLEGVVQRSHSYAIVDEVDSILVDEARTPLIISGEPQTAAKTYYDFARVGKGLRGIQAKNTKLEDEKLAQEYDYLFDEKLAGMTGTAKTEEKEFVEIYDLNVVEIPTNVQVARADENDLIFKTVDAKFSAAVQDIKERHQQGQPVLVGTIAVETSEYLSELLKRQGVPHNVLNAKEHAREAEIIKDAGEVGAVTIATNMAGRGVDIQRAEGIVRL